MQHPLSKVVSRQRTSSVILAVWVQILVINKSRLDPQRDQQVLSGAAELVSPANLGAIERAQQTDPIVVNEACIVVVGIKVPGMSAQA